MTADLAISGTTTDTFAGEACSETLANPIQYVAWWMLTFPVDTVYITDVQIYNRYNSEGFFSHKYFFRYILLPYTFKQYTLFCNLSKNYLIISIR